MTTFGQFLQQERHARGLSQQSLAERLGTSRQTIIALEKGQHWPSLEMAMDMARIFDCSLDRLASFLSTSASVALRLFPGSELLKGAQPVVCSRMGTTRIIVPTALLGATQDYPDAVWDPRTQLLTPLPGARREDRVILVGGCDPFLPWLSQTFHEKYPDWHIQPIRLSSQRALKAFHDRLLHVAGIHIFDEVSGHYNPQHLVSVPHIKIPYLRWVEGLLHQIDEPIERIAIREPGSEAHSLFVRRGQHLAHPTETFFNHHSVLEMVRTRSNWAGVGLGALGVPHGLAFDPWAEEQYDLFIARDDAASEWATAFLDTVTSRQLSARLSHLPHILHTAP